MGAAAGVLPPGGMGMRVLGMIAAAGWPCKYEPSESALIILHTRVQWNMHVILTIGTIITATYDHSEAGGTARQKPGRTLLRYSH